MTDPGEGDSATERMTDPGEGDSATGKHAADTGSVEARLRDLLESLHPIGRHPETGGYRRFAWTPADRECRDWFHQQARARDLAYQVDRNGNQWAWWGESRTGAVVTGSHLDSVPDGGALDGPLGVVSAFVAIDLLRSRDFVPAHSVAVVNFADEEGARFGVACAGSRLLTGALDPDRARSLAAVDGTTMAAAMRAAGHDPNGLGRDDEALAAIGVFVELHVEQGRALADLAAPVGVGSAIWPHGRWRFDFAGRADHAGTTKLADRHDPMLPFATTVLAARDEATKRDILATFGRVLVEPNGTNAIPSRVTAWLDARGPDPADVEALVAAVASRSTGTVTRESWTPPVEFDRVLRERIVTVLEQRGGSAPPVLATGAGHDAGILAAEVPTAMLFVRNPTGVSHSPAEHAELADCVAGVEALAAVLAELAGR
ncbi:MAG TPA: allantoate amidohydrolase [Actinomycetes bacterium]|nr:allantoate amidohydrolase [Actinomycetes bacterium]